MEARGRQFDREARGLRLTYCSGCACSETLVTTTRMDLFDLAAALAHVQHDEVRGRARCKNCRCYVRASAPLSSCCCWVPGAEKALPHIFTRLLAAAVHLVRISGERALRRTRWNTLTQQACTRIEAVSRTRARADNGDIEMSNDVLFGYCVALCCGWLAFFESGLRHVLTDRNWVPKSGFG